MFREPTILHAWPGVFVRNEEVELTTTIFRRQTAKYLNNKNGDAIVILFLIASECVYCIFEYVPSTTIDPAVT